MLPFYRRSFKKDYRKLSPGMQSRFNERLKLFLNDPFHPLLNNHPLHGEWEGYYSINITGDLRAIFKVGDDTAIFVAIDTHTGTHFKTLSQSPPVPNGTFGRAKIRGIQGKKGADEGGVDAYSDRG